MSTIKRLSGGSNNRCYHVRAGNDSLFAKIYFRHKDDPRDRLRAEFSFLTYAWDAGIRNIAKPLVADHENGIGLYAFLSGSPLSASDITAEAVGQAGSFIKRVNQARALAAEAALPIASEACFSYAEHLACVQCRVDHLSGVDGASPVAQSARRLINESILPLWCKIRDAIPSSPVELSLRERCLSPSDFGFHNALRTSDGLFFFYDFEYAGWDDPAKLVCDFFSQPRLSVPEEHLGVFTTAVGRMLTSRVQQRMDVLLPLFRLKWLCILFNEFLPVAANRRAFSRSQEDVTNERCSQQLRKIRSFLAKWFPETV